MIGQSGARCSHTAPETVSTRRLSVQIVKIVQARHRNDLSEQIAR